MVKFLLWLLLLFFCWPLAILALILYPIVWLISLPFRLVGITLDGVFELLKAILCCRRVCSGDLRELKVSLHLFAVAPKSECRQLE